MVKQQWSLQVIYASKCSIDRRFTNGINCCLRMFMHHTWINTQMSCTRIGLFAPATSSMQFAALEGSNLYTWGLSARPSLASAADNCWFCWLKWLCNKKWTGNQRESSHKRQNMKRPTKHVQICSDSFCVLWRLQSLEKPAGIDRNTPQTWLWCGGPHEFASSAPVCSGSATHSNGFLDLWELKAGWMWLVSFTWILRQRLIIHIGR